MKRWGILTDSYDVRRYLAIIFMAGGSISMTGILIYIIPLLSQTALFWVAMGCLTLIAIQQTGFAALLVKRSIRFDLKDREFEVIDHDSQSGGHTDGKIGGF